MLPEPSGESRPQRKSGRARALLLLEVVGALAVLLFIGVAVDFFWGGSTRDGYTSREDLKPGDCFNGTIVGESFGKRLLIDCSKPHEFQVLSADPLPEGPYPGRRKVSDLARELCDRRWGTPLLQSPYAGSHEFLILAPTADSWRTGRTTVCLLQSVGGKTTSKVDLSAETDPGKKTWRRLRPGDCLKLTEEATDLVQTLPCDRPHTDQVIKSFTLPQGPWPGQKKVERTIDIRCAGVLDAFFEKHPSFLLLAYSSVHPTRSDWTAGERRALCLVSSSDGDALTRSLIP